MLTKLWTQDEFFFAVTRNLFTAQRTVVNGVRRKDSLFGDRETLNVLNQKKYEQMVQNIDKNNQLDPDDIKNIIDELLNRRQPLNSFLQKNKQFVFWGQPFFLLAQVCCPKKAMSDRQYMQQLRRFNQAERKYRKAVDIQ